MTCDVGMALQALDRDDWRFFLHRSRSDGRRAVGQLLKIAGPSKSADPSLLIVKSARLTDERIHALAPVVAQPCIDVARSLLGTASDSPSSDDLRRIWRPWNEKATSGLVRLSLVVVANSDMPAAAAARELLDDLDRTGKVQLVPDDMPPDDPEVEATITGPAQAAHLGTAAGIARMNELLGEVVTASQSAAEAAQAVSRAVDSDTMLPGGAVAAIRAADERLRAAVVEAAAVAAQLDLDVRIEAPITHALRTALAAAAARQEEEQQRLSDDRRRSARLAELEAASAALAPLATVTGPAVHDRDIGTLRRLAQVPQAEADQDRWLLDLPIATGVLDHLMGQATFPSEHYGRLSALTSPAVLGLLVAGQLSLERDASEPPGGVVAAGTDVHDATEGLAAEGSEAGSEPLPVGGSVEAPVAAPVEAEEGTTAATEPAARTVDDASQSIRGDDSDGGGADATAETAVANTPEPAASSDTHPPIEPNPKPHEHDEEGWHGVARLVADGHADAAAWAAQALDRRWGAALEALAVALRFRSSSGPLTNAMWSIAQALPQQLQGADPSLAVSALCLGSAVSPYSGACDALAHLAERLPAGSLRVLADKTVEAARLGFAIGHGPSALTGNNLAEVQAAAREQLDQAGARNLKFHRATRVYQAWMTDGGLLGQLLLVARDDRREQVQRVRESLQRLADEREIERAIDDTDARLRAPNATTKIVAQPRQRLLELAREALEVVDRWTQLASTVQPAGSTIAELGPELQHAASGAVRELEDAQGTDEPIARVVAQGSVLALQTLLGWLRNGVPSEDEPVLDDALDGWLPLVFEQRLSRDSWGTVAAAALPGLLAAPYRSAADAYEGFSARADHVGSARLIEYLRGRDDAAAAQLDQQREHDVRSARAALDRRREQVQTSFDELESYPGLLTPAEAVQVRALLVDAEDPDGLQAGRALTEASALLDTALRRATDELRGQMDLADLAPDDRDAVEHMMGEGSLSAAHERLHAASSESVSEATSVEDYAALQRRFWDVQLPAAMVPGLLERATSALEAGEGLDGFGPAPAEPQDRTQRAQALRAWKQLFEHKRAGDFENRMRAVLGLIGLQGPAPRKDPERVYGTHLAVNLRNAQPVQPVTSFELGSGAHGQYRVLVVWDEMPADRLVSLAMNDPKQGPFIVLYGGVLSAKQRASLAEATRSDAAASKRIVVVDVAVVLALALHARPSFAVLEHLTLPFARAEVYAPDVAGNVPPELFRGRRRELDAVVSPNGSSFVYGGRQVGKSALLRAAAREVEAAEDPDRRAVYLDVKALGLGLWRDAEELWLELLDELKRRGVLMVQSSRAARGDAVVNHLRTWLDEKPNRRLLVLLDECDELLDNDARRQFPIVERLRGLMATTDRRFKVVLAGLHQVQRFERQRNVPLAHLTQQPVNIGPLNADDAVDLLRAPLLALGYQLDDAATWRLLSHTNYQPGLIQAFGQAVLRALQDDRGRSLGLPAKVDRAFIERVYAEADLGEQMRRRFMLTIYLDDRYRCIAYVMALRNLQDGMTAAYPDGELQAACAYWWPQGFGAMLPALFKSLVEEMIGLGVLVRVNNTLRIRNPNVVRLLGSRSDIEAELLEFEDMQPPLGFQASLYRRAMGDGRRSPLTEEALGATVGVDSPGLVVIGGTLALGVDLVLPAVEHKLAERPDVTVVRTAAPDASRALQEAAGRTVVLVDGTALSVDLATAAVREMAATVAAMPRGTALRRAVLVLGPAARELWSEDGGEQTAPGATTLRLERLGLESIEAWAGEEHLGLDRKAQQELHALTGGWPILVGHAMRLKASGSSWSTAAAAAHELAVSQPGFVESVLGDDAGARRLVQLLADMGEPVAWSDLVAVSDQPLGPEVRAVATAFGLTESRGDQVFELEPVLAEAIGNTGRA